MSSKNEELKNIVGGENLLDDAGTLKAYSHDQSFARPMKPRSVVKPESVEQVQKIIQWANRTRTPLVPVSSGPPHFHGDTVPSVPGAVIVDLSGMKRVIRINRRNRIAIIEPGVTYSQLQPELAKEGLRLLTPLLPRVNKSVMASLLERQPTLVPRFQWAALDPLRCLEVIWGDGEMMTTGEARGMGSLEEEWKINRAQVDPKGPGQTDFYRLISGAQGSMGIVTWASVKCEVLPECRKFFFVPSQSLDNLIDFTYRLLRFRFGDELLLLNSSNLASILAGGSDRIKALQEKLPRWILIVGVTGGNVLPGERVDSLEKDIREIAQQSGLQLLTAVPGASDSHVLEALLDPSREPYWKLDYKGGCQDIFFMTTLDRTPQFVQSMFDLAGASDYPSTDIGVYLQPVHQGASCHCEFNLPFDPADRSEVTRIKGLFITASEELSRQGAFFSRPYGIWADIAYHQDAQATTVLKKIKNIFDPVNVMNPGKLCF